MPQIFGRNNDNSSLIRRSGFLHGMQCVSVYGSQEEMSEDRRRLSSTVEIDDDDLGSCSSSSIGRNSDDHGESQSDDDDPPEAEVQSQTKGPLDTRDALEEVLPMR
ncbi:Damaged dna-binding 2, putative isoform 2 [Hibiscus syriacus]|uniref:Damaged dna-binding 2, putative isoform 2 n=1 Tax=Hibiscus syriacus TaxID=106335 RepID=A0A6A3C5V6_HIBSY|nr:Damaged dna-binding 2, putative isoform 2 [Hibiscus syriacus]